MEEVQKYRTLWWTQGNIHPLAEWDKAELPYIIAKDVTIDKYEEHSDRFNSHRCWEWEGKFKQNDIVLGNVSIYELPSQAHEVCIGAIVAEINYLCFPVMRTEAKIFSLGATCTRADNSGNESDASFRPEKFSVASNGSNGMKKPWPNVVIEVAFAESIGHVKDKARNYWLRDGRVHDVIIVKIEYVPENQIPKRMRAWHYCISGTYDERRKLKPINKFEFGSVDADGSLLNYGQGTRVMKIINK